MTSRSALRAGLKVPLVPPFRQVAARHGVITRGILSRPLRPTNPLDALDWTEIRIGFDF